MNMNIKITKARFGAFEKCLYQKLLRNWIYFIPKFSRVDLSGDSIFPVKAANCLRDHRASS